MTLASLALQAQSQVTYEWSRIRAQDVIVAPDRDAMRFLLDIYTEDRRQPYHVKPREDGAYLLIANSLDVSRMLDVRTMDNGEVNSPRVARSKINEWLAEHPLTVRPLDDTVEVHLEQQPFEQVIFMLASSRNQEYTVSMGVVGNVTLELNRVPWETAFRHAMIQVDAYSIELDGVTHYMSAGMNRTLGGKVLRAAPSTPR